MNKNIRTKLESKSSAGRYWKKSLEFAEGMKYAFDQAKWNSAALEGIHAAISAADAALIATRGLKSASERHMDVVTLVSGLPLDGASEAANHLARILNLKSEVEYTGDQLSQKDAHEILVKVDRFMNWVKKAFPSSLLT